jgi:GNAT superfamily N-acetyltransferase
MSLLIRPANEADLPLLAQMNKRLIEDEGSRNPMSIDRLADRMRGWLLGDWQVKLFATDAGVVGYAVYQPRRDEYFPDQTIVHLRQFYIERETRGQGLGTAAFRALAAEHFPPDCRVVIDALASNPRGYDFWRHVGFEPYCTTMHLRNEA